MEGETHSGSDQKPNMKTEEDDETKAMQVSLATLFAIQNTENSSSSNPSSAAEESHLIIPSCDCISIRSSSTTSTQSFAFPILASEFHSSPAKMAPCDTRFLKKRRRWKNCLGFCKC
nr:protein BREAKING OF ASYMMETRY IN THE STOMATAL LINEAGE-like isoform X3 [Ipomoea batatas]